ncbi:MAG: DNA-processing protein DprA [Clostridia bacterium]|nr:DNA-processing protein DprA [Clostridia bacterium]
MNQIKEISILDENYPELLKSIYDPPKCLYVVGNIEILNSPGIAIVGCREATEYGKKAAMYFSYNLAKQGITIVSGLARGIDSYSHIGALQAKGNTIAVIGSGLDIIYPKENEQLAKKIIEQGGAIISEYPLGTRPTQDHFPARNRIISGLSKAVLVVEAKEKSGSLITADFAMEQGKEVYAVPGNINSLNSVGTNNLIKDGAIPVSNFSDILT